MISLSPKRLLLILFGLRWFHLTTQAAVVAGIHFGFELLLPLAPLKEGMALLLVWNLLVWWRLRQPWPITQPEVLLNLLLDIAALSWALYWTGGATNPFVSLFLFPVALGAVALSWRYLTLVTASTMLAYTLLMWHYVALPPVRDRFGGDFNLHIFGMWINYLIAAVMIAVFVGMMSRTVRKRDAELNRQRETALRDEGILALGTLAASAAHELNTPLSTIGLLVDELQEQCSDQPHTVECVETIQTQLDQCRLFVRQMRRPLGSTL